MMRTLSQLAAVCGGQLMGTDRPFGEVVIDTRKLAAGDVFAALRGERVDGHDYVSEAARRGAAGALVEREQTVPLAQIRVASVERALAAAGRAARAAFSGPVVGVAGSNGKTTVKEMITAILSQRAPCLATRGNLNNQLGVPLTLLRLTQAHWSAVIEVGANRAGDVAELVQWARPTIGLITNAGAEHLEGFGSLEGVARAEGEMVAALPPEATAVLNAEFTPCNMPNRRKATTIDSKVRIVRSFLRQRPAQMSGKYFMPPSPRRRPTGLCRRATGGWRNPPLSDRE